MGIDVSLETRKDVPAINPILKMSFVARSMEMTTLSSKLRDVLLANVPSRYNWFVQSENNRNLVETEEETGVDISRLLRQCTACGNVSSSQLDMKIHMHLHCPIVKAVKELLQGKSADSLSPSEEFTCDECSYIFKSREKLRLHEKNRAGRNVVLRSLKYKFQCNKCGASFKGFAHLM